MRTGMRKFRIDQDFLIEHWHMIYIMWVVFAEIYVWMKLKLNFRYKISINWLVSIDILLIKAFNKWFKIAFSPFWSQPTYFPDWEWLTVLIPVRSPVAQLVECSTWDHGVTGLSHTGGTGLCAWTRHFILCLVLVHYRKVTTLLNNCWQGWKASTKTNTET